MPYLFNCSMTYYELAQDHNCKKDTKDLFIQIDCCEDLTCHHFDEVISIIAGSPLSDTLVNLSLKMDWINVHDQFGAKCLELRQMKTLKKIDVLVWGGDWGQVEDILRKNLPHLTIIDDWMGPADTYAKHDRTSKSGFWEISCNRSSMFPDK